MCVFRYDFVNRNQTTQNHYASSDLLLFQFRCVWVYVYVNIWCIPFKGATLFHYAIQFDA